MYTALAGYLSLCPLCWQLAIWYVLSRVEREKMIENHEVDRQAARRLSDANVN